MTGDQGSPPPAPAVLKPEKDYRGVRGWLLLLCVLMLLFIPSQRGYVVYSDLSVLSDLYGETSFEQAVVANLRIAVGIEVFLVFCSGLFSLAAGLALLREKRSGPRLGKLFWASGPVLNALLLLSAWCFFPPGEIFDSAATQIGRDLVGSLLGGALWISYLIRSKRVKATYGTVPAP